MKLILGGVFNKVILTRIVLFVVFALVAGIITWIAGWLTYRGRPDELDVLDLEGPIPQYRAVVERSVKRFLTIIPIVIALVAGFLGQQNWQTVQLFLNRQSFGVSDPQFGMDYGFYAFMLPALRLGLGTVSILVAVAFLLSLIGHYLLGSIRIGNQAAGVRGSISSYARVQLSVTAGLWMLLKVASYWLDRYDLLNNRHEC